MFIDTSKVYSFSPSDTFCMKNGVKQCVFQWKYFCGIIRWNADREICMVMLYDEFILQLSCLH